MWLAEGSEHTVALRTSWRVSLAREGPTYDVAWLENDTLTVCEVKSLTTANQVGQIRLGLGQVLDYAHTLRGRGHKVRPVLVVEQDPLSSHWSGLCSEHGLTRVWPDTLNGLWKRASDLQARACGGPGALAPRCCQGLLSNSSSARLLVSTFRVATIERRREDPPVERWPGGGYETRGS